MNNDTAATSPHSGKSHGNFETWMRENYGRAGLYQNADFLRLLLCLVGLCRLRCYWSILFEVSRRR